MRYLIAVLVLGLLSACGLGATSPSEQPLPSIGASTEASTDAGGSADASASDDMTAMGCDDAWTSVDATRISTIADLEAAASDLEATIRDCDSLQDWTDGAERTLPNLDVSEVQAWATARCSADDTLGQTSVCAELNA